MKTILFVVGMHRSGTSAFAGSATLLGAQGAQNTFGPDAANPKGYFEPVAVVAASDAALERAGRSWHDCRKMPTLERSDGDAIVSNFVKALNSEFDAETSIAVIKDPRISVLLPYWIRAAREFGAEPVFAIMVRSPSDVADSLIRREEMPPEQALAAWLRNSLDAEVGTRGAKRILVDASRFVADPVGTLEETGEVLGIQWPNPPRAKADALRSFIEPGLFHQKAKVDSPLLPVADDLHRALLALAAGEDAATADIDRIAQGFDALAPAMQDLMVGTKQALRVSHLKMEIVQLRAMLGTLRDQTVAILNRPWRALDDLIQFKLADWMLSRRVGQTGRRVERLRRSRDKRDPSRFGRQMAALLDVMDTPRESAMKMDRPSPDSFVPYAPQDPIEPDVKAIAFYLPQFHPFPENDQWWGKGFTEWTNVGKALPNYEGHYQPHCPIHLGYYDLRIPDVMEGQARLAREHGVHGFSYYFYWFGGKTLMETPLQAMLANPKVDLPFCLTWANENWTRRWDGMESDVLIAQDHSRADSIAFLHHLNQYFVDPRYIRVDGKPMLIVYRPTIIPDIEATVALWREEALKLGLPGLHLVGAETFGTRDLQRIGFDAAVEFPPHGVRTEPINWKFAVTNPDFRGNIFDYNDVSAEMMARPEPDHHLYRTVTLSWDNTARKQNNPNIFAHFTLDRYAEWLEANCAKAMDNQKYAEKFVFINAWNEWAEGTHLEPDRRFGFAYLQATRKVMAKFRSSRG